MTNEQTHARIAALEAERSEAMIAVGLTGYDHREDVDTPAQCIYALWADHNNLRELYEMQEAVIAASREREAALAAALDIARQEIEACRQDVTGTYAEARFAGVLAELADPTAILATLRREAKREALKALEAATPAPPELSEDHDERMHSDNGGDIRDAAYDEGYRDARMGDLNRIGAALVALATEEKGARNG